MRTIQRWLFISAIAGMAALAGACSQQDKPSPAQVENALHARARQVLGGCPLFDYSQLKIDSLTPAAQGEGVSAVVDYRVNSLMKGHKFDTSHPPATLPGWFPKACSRMFSAADPATQRRMVSFIQNEFDHSGSTVLDDQTFGAFMFGRITLDVSKVSLSLQRSDDGWRVPAS